MNSPEFDSIFARIPLLDGLTVADFRITRLGGYTNHNYRLSNDRFDWILRIPKPMTNQFIDREAETHNQNLACQLDIAPQVAWRDTLGMTLTPVLSQTRAARARDVAENHTLQRMLTPIRMLHDSEIPFRGLVDLDSLLERYFGLLGPSEQVRMQPRLDQARRVLKLLEDRDLPSVPSHNDLVLENLLFDARKVWLIDWEYSAMAPPYWDLATLCNAANLDLAQSRRLLQLYCADHTLLEEQVLFDYRGLLKLLSDCWMCALAR